jgi:RNA polymerase primary sigma factor
MSSSLERYINDLSQYPLLTNKEEKELYKKLKNPRYRVKAREKLIVSNLRLVIKIATGYNKRGGFLSLEDLVNEGNIGLCTAAKKFDPTRGVKFSTYSSFWIKQNIIRALEMKSRTIRLPSGVSSLSIKIEKFKDSFNEEHDRQPSVAEIAKKFKVKEDRVKLIMLASKPASSLDIEVGDGKDKGTIGDLFVGSMKDSPDEVAKTKDRDKSLNDCLNTLTDREIDILKNRFGLEDYDIETLEKIGEKYNLTRERIRQIQSAALEKLSVIAEKSELYEK